jgi:hypothetical protein
LTCSHEAFRAGLGIITAVLLPLTLPYFDERRLYRVLITGGLAMVTLAPWFDRFWPAWSAVVASVAIALLLPLRHGGPDKPDGLDSNDPTRPRIDQDRAEGLTPTRLDGRLSLATIGVCVALAFLTIILLDPSALTALRMSLQTYSSTSLIIFGWLFATLIAGSVIERLVQPFTKELAEIMSKKNARSLTNAGRWIGLLERTLIYGSLCAGRPDGVVIVITIKSIARFPQFKMEAFAEYYLVGTLLSLLAALIVGGAVRVLLCWPAIPTP